MNQPPAIPPLKFTTLEKALRIAAAVGVCGLSTANILVAGYITGKFELIFKDMLCGKPLPLLTQFIMYHQTALLLIAILMPLTVSICAICARSNVKFAFIVGAVVAAIFFQISATIFGLFCPLSVILNQLQASP